MPNRLRELRNARKLHLEQVADRIGCSISYVSDLERGLKPLTMPWMERFARFYKVEVADILSEQHNSKSLSGEEQQLLGLFGQADETQRAAVLSMLQTLVGAGKRKAA